MEESRLDTTHTTEMIGAVAKVLGREVKVYVAPAAIRDDDSTGSSRSSAEEVPEDFYEFTAADYAALQASKKEEVYLKTRKIRDREQAAKRAQRTKATIRVHFPDGFVVEANFKSIEAISELMELVRKVIVRPDLPFYLYTTPPKRPIRDLLQNMLDASLTPGANVYFAYNPSQDVPSEGPYLRPEVQELQDLHKLVQPLNDNGMTSQQAGPTETVQAPEAPAKRTSTTKGRPKWLKM